MGTTLHVLMTDKNGLNKLLLTENIFKNFNINGIKTMTQNDNNSEQIENDMKLEIAVYGNRFLTIYELVYNKLNEKLSLNELMKSHNFHDWIIDVRLSHEIVFIVKALNEVVLLNRKTNQLINTISGKDKCILYSAELLCVTLSPIGFVLSSGTVFKEIVIWSSFEGISNTLQTLKGHDGVIFAINYNKELNLLVSASDDRSVRIWTAHNHSISFSNSIDFWDKNKFFLSHIFYGHLARIWKVFIISNPFPILISVGEDSSLCFWNIFEKKLIQKVEGHKNASIWSLAVDSQSLITYSGGSDACLTVCDILDVITPFKSVLKYNLDPKQVLFICGKPLNIFCSTNNGDLLLMSSFDNHVIPITDSDIKHVFKNFCSIDVNEERNKILLGSKCGKIAFIEIDSSFKNPYKISVRKAHNGKVFSVCFVSCDSFISCTNNGELNVRNLNDFSLTGEYDLPNSRHRWAVTGLLLNQMLIIGDRCGSIFVYVKSNSCPTQEYRSLHGRHGVTAIKLKPKSNFIYSSGRNGKIFEFLIEENQCSLLRTFRTFADMEWIGKFEFDKKSGQLSYICGFESRNFVVWDEREKRFIYSIECGGGHRSWDFTIVQNELHFCYTKQEKLFCFHKQLSKIHNSPEVLSLSLSKTSHCKKINCCSVLFDESIRTSLFYFATAGEDNVININSLDTKMNVFKVELVLCGHISNICALTACCAQLNSVSYLVSVGGRSQLMIFKIEMKDQTLICKQIINNFLWPSDSFKQKAIKSSDSLLSDLQIRYLDANISKISEQKYLISTACSDSAFRLFIFDKIKLQLISITSFNTSCILKVLNIFKTHIITASNDGTLKIWSLLEGLFENMILDPMVDNQMNLSSVFQMRFHESGINALDVFHFNGIFQELKYDFIKI